MSLCLFLARNRFSPSSLHTHPPLLLLTKYPIVHTLLNTCYYYYYCSIDAPTIKITHYSLAFQQTNCTSYPT